jgi:branched-chain amino acid transport system substrate-binding protein
LGKHNDENASDRQPAGGLRRRVAGQAAEFGIMKDGQKAVGLLVWPTDIAALGLDTAQGILPAESWYCALGRDQR